MSDREDRRPRRAWQLDDETESPPPDVDDTSGHDLFRPRRDAAARPEGVTPIPPPVFPRSAGEYAASPSPAPRRSALSSQTPPEPEPPGSAGSRRSPLLAGLGDSMAKWAIGGVVGALGVGMVAFLAVRGSQPADPTSSPPASAASASPSSGLPPVTEEHLLTGADLAGVAPAASWAVAATSTALGDHEGRIACLSTENPAQNPTTSLQRTLGTSDADQLAALHRIDVYASPAAAEEVFRSRTAALSGCAEVPSRIVRASSVTGLGDQAFQITVAFENQPAQFHTILMTRVGAAVQILDLARSSGQVEPKLLGAAVTRPQAGLCEAEAVTCTLKPTVSAAVVPPVEPVGWLIPADLPRIRAGAGRWTAAEPGALTSQGMGCENLTLVSEPGPKSRRQATYLMTQDDQAPATFGVDEMMFTFADASAATAFATKLGNAIASCNDRVNTAKVTELKAVSGTGADGMAVSSRLFSIRQDAGNNKGVPYQLLVSVAGARVAYTIVTVTDSYKFTEAQLAELGVRIPVRASQG